MSVQFNSKAQVQPTPIEKEWWEEGSEEEAMSEIDVEFVRLQIEQILDRPCQANVAKLLSPTGTSNLLNPEEFKNQVISNFRPSK